MPERAGQPVLAQYTLTHLLDGSVLGSLCGRQYTQLVLHHTGWVVQQLKVGLWFLLLLLLLLLLFLLLLLLLCLISGRGGGGSEGGAGRLFVLLLAFVLLVLILVISKINCNNNSSNIVKIIGMMITIKLATRLIKVTLAQTSTIYLLSHRQSPICTGGTCQFGLLVQRHSPAYYRLFINWNHYAMKGEETREPEEPLSFPSSPRSSPKCHILTHNVKPQLKHEPAFNLSLGFAELYTTRRLTSSISSFRSAMFSVYGQNEIIFKIFSLKWFFFFNGIKWHFTVVLSNVQFP